MHQFEGPFSRRDRLVKLARINLVEDIAEDRPGHSTGGDQIVAGDDGLETLGADIDADDGDGRSPAWSYSVSDVAGGENVT